MKKLHIIGTERCATDIALERRESQCTPPGHFFPRIAPELFVHPSPAGPVITECPRSAFPAVILRPERIARIRAIAAAAIAARTNRTTDREPTLIYLNAIAHIDCIIVSLERCTRRLAARRASAVRHERVARRDAEATVIVPLPNRVIVLLLPAPSQDIPPEYFAPERRAALIVRLIVRDRRCLCTTAARSSRTSSLRPPEPSQLAKSDDRYCYRA